MPFFNELTTVYDVRSQYLSVTGTGDDTLLLQLIRSVSNDIARIARVPRQFVPKIETRTFDLPFTQNAIQSLRRRSTLMLDNDLLAATTLTNGDATTIAASDYWLLTQNFTPKWGIQLKTSSGLAWQVDSNGNYEQCISLAGIWGYHENYTDAWVTLKAASDGVTAVTVNESLSASDTGITVSAAPTWKGGQLWKIESEYLYLSSGTSTTATVIRGVNGSTAATHASASAISVWTIDFALEQLAQEASAARYRLRNNPLAESFVAQDGTTFVAPKDVDKFIARRMSELGLVRN